jgi:uncharacterized cupin superfamily protein
MSARILKLDIEGVTPEESAPPPERILSGTPVFRTWDIEQTGKGIYAGIWESTPGKWAIDYEEWEYFHMLSGISVVTEEGGRSVRLGPGDSYILRPGFKGSWEVVETTRKEYVIYF